MNKVFFIAEVGSNHDGDLERAKKLIDIAIDAKADAIKFQLIPPFKPEWIDILIEYCNRYDDRKIEFMATPFNQEGIETLRGKVKRWKIASTEAADPTFVKAVCDAANNWDEVVYISDGAIDYKVYEDERHIPLHCVPKYPAHVIDYDFKFYRADIEPWGVSDHTQFTILPVIAVAAGATVIEKHFTDDPSRSGPDHVYALNPEQLKETVRMVRDTEGMFSGKKIIVKDHVGRKIQWP